jgi:hypothetical protein
MTSPTGTLPVLAAHLVQVVAQGAARQELQDQVLGVVEYARIIKSHDIVVASSLTEDFDLSPCTLRV